MTRRLPKPSLAPARPKLADVARAAGVSLATASRVINNPEIVRPAMQERVRRAISALGFAPDGAARALALGRSRTIGAVVPTLGIAIFADGVEALQNRLSPAGYTLLLANSQYDVAKETQEIAALLERGVDGLVLVGDRFSPQTVRLIRQYGTPTVITYVTRSRSRIPAVGIDNLAASRSMAEYLLSLGHRRFGIIANTTTPNDRTQARRVGMVRALADAGIDLSPDRIEEVPHSIASGRVALRRLLAREPAPTAVMCTSDALAIGALAESHRLGLRVPERLSITGFDDVGMAAETEPALTTVHVPAREIGQFAADHLLAMLAGRPVSLQTALDAPLVIRGSAGAVWACAPQSAGRRADSGRKRPGCSAAQRASAK